ncbi:ComEA family DNA-binding protein [Porcipelethomonas sp.]|uniref:ComEA family DNA-binding protein n=1 Tax=Porcipelethomonas sp. TaxID=2981675 RepID=UPI003EF0F03D
MNKTKAAIYFSVSVILIFSLALILSSKENKKEDPEITGNYQFWETQAAYEKTSEPITETSVQTIAATSVSSAEKQSRSRKATTVKSVTEPVKETTAEEYVYLDLNQAGVEELVKLKGIGYATAEKIIEYRNNYGPFLQTCDIMNVNGIGEKTYNDIREHIYVTISAEDYAVIQQQQDQDVAAEEEITQQYQENPQTVTDKPVITENYVQETTEFTIPVLDINTASVSDFEKLPGIDRETAENIVSLRTAIKSFSHVYELLYAENMTESKLAAILDYVYVKKEE